MGGVIGVIKEAAGYISRNFGKVKSFLVGLVKTIEWIEKIILIGKMLIKLVRNSREIIAKFFSNNVQVGSTKVDLHNIDDVLNTAEQLESRYS